MSELTKAILAGVLRAVLAALSGYLVQHGVLTTDQASSAAAVALERALEMAPFALAVAGSVLHKIRVNERMGGWL